MAYPIWSILVERMQLHASVTRFWKYFKSLNEPDFRSYFRTIRRRRRRTKFIEADRPKMASARAAKISNVVFQCNGGSEMINLRAQFLSSYFTSSFYLVSLRPF